jgi:radical SAM superfamily enzyme YgiQ (UPF0313 family)
VPNIVLTTLNARYAHASLGLRYLRANLGELREQSAICEFVIGSKTEDLVEKLLAQKPHIIGLGVYIWNVSESTALVAQLKMIAPHIVLVLGGPEVSYETNEQALCQQADYVITGWGDLTFAKLAKQILAGQPPENRLIVGEQPPLDLLNYPYAEYTDEDIRQRHLYVEASRGCPFKCEFCLSALDKTAWPFALDTFLAELASLWDRGARTFKFVDRTFNLKIETSLQILAFFQQRINANPKDPPFLHFELVPDHLPERLKDAITAFPPGTLQFEIGIQSFNPTVQALVSRKQKNEVAVENLRWLREHTTAHLHVDLIAGLPGESVASFAAGFDRLVALRPHEIQFGILKRLRGTPIIRHTIEHRMQFNPAPPYNILANDQLDFATLQSLSRFSRYWDLLGNSGRFKNGLALLLADAPFNRFMAFSEWLYARCGQTHAIPYERLMNFLHDYLVDELRLSNELVVAELGADYLASGARSKLDFVDLTAALRARDVATRQVKSATPARQRAHMS